MLNIKKSIMSLSIFILSVILTFSALTGCSSKISEGSVEPSAEVTLSPEEIAAAEAEAKEVAALSDFKNRFYDNFQNDNFDAKNIALTFAVISDMHIGLYDQTAKVERGMQFICRRVQNSLDAVLVNGDITNHYRASANENFIIEASNVLINNVPDNTVFFYSLGTSHDADGFNTTTNKSGETQREAFDKYLDSRFSAANIETQEERIEDGYKHALIKGYNFISLDNEKGSYSNASLKWLKNTLNDLTSAEPNKPVFVMSHIPADSSLDNVLKDFSQVIYFSAHEHIPFNTPKSILQDNYTALSIGGFAYYRDSDVNSLSLQDNNNNYEYGQGYLIEVDNNGNTRVIRLDLYNEVALNECWVIPSPKEDNSHLNSYPSSLYKNYEKVEFPENASISVDVNEANPLGPVKITFPAAKSPDGQPVTMYNVVVEIIEGSGTTRTERMNISSLYMKYPNNEGMPEAYSVTVDGVAPPYCYNITVKGYNCVSKASSSLKCEFKSEGYNEIISNSEASAS